MFGLIKNIFIWLLNDLVNECNHTKCMSLINQKCMIWPTFVHLHHSEYKKNFNYSFAVKLDRFVGSCNTLNDLCVPNETEDLNLSAFKMIAGINESKTLTNNISHKCKWKLDGRKCNSDEWWNNNKCRCECKKLHVCEKDYVWNPATCSCEIV